MPRRRTLYTFTRKEIARLFRVSKRTFKHLAFDLLAYPKTNANGRLLVVTPKAVGSAPIRNKARRRIKEIFYTQKLFERGYDCIIIVKKDGATLSFDALQELVLRAFPVAISE